MAIAQTYLKENYGSEKFSLLAPILLPPYFQAKQDTRFISLPNDTLDFYISIIIVALQREFFFHKESEPHVGFQVDDFCNILKHLPEDMLPEYKRKKDYVAAFLAKSDFLERKNPFLVRLRKGYYTMLLTIELLVNDEWVKLVELFDFHTLKIMDMEGGGKAFYDDVNQWAVNVQDFVEKLVEKQIKAEDGDLHTPDEDLQDWPA